MNIIYFDKNKKFKNDLIETLKFDADNVIIQDIESESDLFKAVQIEAAQAVLIDLYSLEDNVIQKIRELKKYCSDKLIIILMNNCYKMLDRYMISIGASCCVDKNKDVYSLIEFLKQYN